MSTKTLIALKIMIAGTAYSGVPALVINDQAQSVYHIESNLSYYVDTTVEFENADYLHFRQASMKVSQTQQKELLYNFLDKVKVSLKSFTQIKSNLNTFQSGVASPLKVKRYQGVWYHMNVSYELNRKRSFILEMGTSHMSYVEVIITDDEYRVIRRMRNGALIYYLNETTPGGSVPFPVTFDPSVGNYHFFILTWSNNDHLLTTRLSDPLVYGEQQEVNEKILLLYLGSMFGLISFNLGVFALSRDSQNYWYIPLSATLAGMVALQKGVFFEYDDIFGHLLGFNDLVTIMMTICSSCSLMFTLHFLHLYQKLPIVCKYFKFLAVGMLLFGVIGVLQKAKLVYNSFNYSTIVILGFISLVVIRLLLKKDRYAIQFSFAFSFMVFGGIVTTLHRLGILPTNLFTENSLLMGSVSESILISVAVGDKLNILSINLQRVNTKLQHYISIVEKTVDERTRHITSIMAHIKQGIFTIQPNIKIDEYYSKNLEEILEKSEISGKDPIDLFLKDSNLIADEQERIRSALINSLGEDLLNFSINASHLPREITYKDKILALDWQPICDSSQSVEKIMVVLRNETEKRKLELLNQKHTQEMNRIKEILAVPKEQSAEFLHECSLFLAENRQLISTNLKLNREVLRILFINYHTIKGNARSLNFRLIVDSVHQSESLCTKLIQNETTWDQNKLLADLSLVEDSLKTYQEISIGKLGRTEEDNYSITGKKLDRLIELVNGLSTPDKKQHTELVSEVFEIYFKSSEKVLTEVVAQIPKLAIDLNKAIPDLHITGAKVWLDPKLARVFVNVLSHLLRNSLDHGLEPEDIRISKGKTPCGKISILTEVVETNLLVSVQDDGQGLDLGKIRKIGVKKSLISENVEDSQVIANLIFQEGFSTAHDITEISGRGIGMDAVKSIVEKSNGTIELKLINVADHVLTDHAPCKFVLRFSDGFEPMNTTMTSNEIG